MNKLRQEELFFGHVDVNGCRSGIADGQFSIETLHDLWHKFPELFENKCEDGEISYVYAHTITASDNNTNDGKVEVHLYRPSDGGRYSRDGDRERAACRMNAVNYELNGMNRELKALKLSLIPRSFIKEAGKREDEDN